MFKKTTNFKNFFVFWTQGPWGLGPWGPWGPPFLKIFWLFAKWPGTYLKVFLWCLGAQGTPQLNYFISYLIQNATFSNVNFLYNCLLHCLLYCLLYCHIASVLFRHIWRLRGTYVSATRKCVLATQNTCVDYVKHMCQLRRKYVLATRETWVDHAN